VPLAGRAQQAARVPRIGIVDDAPIWKGRLASLRPAGLAPMRSLTPSLTGLKGRSEAQIVRVRMRRITEREAMGGDLHKGSRQIDHELIVPRRPTAFAPLHFSHKPLWSAPLLCEPAGSHNGIVMKWEPDGLRLSKFSDRTCFGRPFSDVGGRRPLAHVQPLSFRLEM
jgi:hypothetical protein